MRIVAVLSDIHGNLPALEAVILDMKELEVDQVVVAGDSILGPHSEQVVDYIIDHNWLVIKGNYEISLLDKGNSIYEEKWMTQENYPVPAWLNEIVPYRLKAIIAEWPDRLSLKYSNAPAICVVHGSPRNAWESIYPTETDEEIEELLAIVTEPIVITSHTHLPMDRKTRKWRVLNPGSVGMPMMGKHEASYLVLEQINQDWRPTFRQVPFANEPVYLGFKNWKFEERYGVTGRLFVETFKTARPQGGFLKWMKTHYPTEALSQEKLDEYYDTCGWWVYAHPAYCINVQDQKKDDT
jgi:predicted phosphodiesterase